MLAGKKILLGITGGISVYKMCTVVRLLKKAGASVRVIMTEAATRFVTPLTFSTLSEEEVVVSLWPSDPASGTGRSVQHIRSGLWADAMLIAPATANTIAQLVHGSAADILTSTALALRAPLIVAPAMDVDMWEHSATQDNVAALRARGTFVISPDSGALASGLEGMGRLPEPEAITAFVDGVLGRVHRDLSKRKILITAGPTYEPIDPVRFIGNRSSGKMGFALANAAALRGADVTLVAGPVSLATPRNVKRIDVGTAEEMFSAVTRIAPRVETVIMSAAVSDYAPASAAPEKMKKNERPAALPLRSTPDILRTLGERKKKRQTLIGFALETKDGVKNAKEKLAAKHLDLIVLNSPKDEGAAFGHDTNVVTLIDASGAVTKLPRMPKFDVAMKILDTLVRKR